MSELPKTVKPPPASGKEFDKIIERKFAVVGKKRVNKHDYKRNYYK